MAWRVRPLSRRCSDVPGVFRQRDSDTFGHNGSCSPIDSHGACGRIGFSGGSVEHRSRGPALCWRNRCCLGGPELGQCARVVSYSGRTRCRLASRGCMGSHTRVHEGKVRYRRGDSDDSNELRGDLSCSVRGPWSASGKPWRLPSD